VIGYRENGTPITEPTPTRQRNVINDVATNINSLPNNPYTGDRNIKLIDVYNNKKTMDQFVAQIQKHDLTDLVMTN
jgi:hypothetical protein